MLGESLTVRTSTTPIDSTRSLVNEGTTSNINNAQSDQIIRNKRTLSKPSLVNFALTNARSLTPKLESMVEAFDELALSFMMITESLLKKETDLNRWLNNLDTAENIKLIHKVGKVREEKMPEEEFVLLSTKHASHLKNT